MNSAPLHHPTAQTKTPGRMRLQQHYVQVPRCLLTGYVNLSDGAKLTYQVLLSFDYVDTESGAHKGFVFPSVETLCCLRGKSRSTIYAHLCELENLGLIMTMPGEGYRLYNAQDGDQEKLQDECLTGGVEAACAPHSGPQTHPNGSLPSADISRPSEPTVQKSGRLSMEEEDEETPQHRQSSEAGDEEETAVFDSLCRLGFDSRLARVFIRRYGAHRIACQIASLNNALTSGAPIRSKPRWLYRAIECNYEPSVSADTTTPARRPQYREEFYTSAEGELRILLTEVVECEGEAPAREASAPGLGTDAYSKRNFQDSKNTCVQTLGSVCYPLPAPSPLCDTTGYPCGDPAEPADSTWVVVPVKPNRYPPAPARVVPPCFLTTPAPRSR